MQNLLSRLFLTVALLGVTACAQSSDCFSSEIFCAALVTDTLGLDDHGMNQDTWVGLQQTKVDGLANQAAYIESIDTRDYEKNIAYFARQGFDVIVTTGPGMSDETLHSADLFPDSVFIGMNQPQEETRPNLIPITFAEDQMGFLAGAFAARLTQTKVVGAVCETSGIDSMWRYCEGFRAGVLSMDKNVKVLAQYRDEGDSEKLFLDEAWGTATAQYVIQRGADVVFAAGGVTGQGAIREAADEGVYAIGSERDQAGALAESNLKVVTSVYGDANFEVQDVMRMLKDGNVGDVGTSQIKYVPLNEKFPEALSSEADELLLSLFIGEIRTNVTSTKP